MSSQARQLAGLTGCYTKTQTDSIIIALKGTASSAFDTLGEIELEIGDRQWVA
jgi:hypothetical protein